ncbi:MAG: magnesium and cobalt exporter, family [Acidimicrobiaceae bacterium]|jgi:CBS domain containing-hemolysin-like protein|nr:magnesium and cobalt exporter, family [Acidimicrobiaceae bacterium]
MWFRRSAGSAESGGSGGQPTAADQHAASIRAALEGLGDTVVREVMTPRVDVVALRSPVSPEDVVLAAKESGHSRFPVYEQDLDDLVGVLYVKDLFRSGGVVRLRQPFVVPETAPVLAVLSQMRVGRNAFAVVVDEHGGVEGVLTVKDLVSQLVGELPDEFDRAEEAEISRVDASRWLVDGACPVDRLQEELGPLGLRLPSGEYVTVGGFLFDRFGRIPGEGDMLVYGGWEFRVSEMDRRRIAKTVVRAPSGTMGDGSPASAPASANGK